MDSSRSSYNLIHLANFNSSNAGNGALSSGLESTIEEDFSKKVFWQREPWDDYTFQLLDFDDAFVEKVNLSDGIIVGGAVTFNGRDYNFRTGTRFELPFELWDRIKKPIIFYGLSYRNWPGQKYFHEDKFKKFVSTCIKKDNICLGVRNDGTKSWIKEKIGIDSDDILEVPDSAVFVKSKIRKEDEIIDGMKNIIIAFNDEDPEFRYQKNPNLSREKIINDVAYSIQEIAKKFDINVILCPHFFDDYRMISDFISAVKPIFFHRNVLTTGLISSKDSDLFYGRYSQVDLAISMRVHSMSPCIGLNVPMIAITTQNRMDYFLEKINLNEQMLKGGDPNLRVKIIDLASKYLKDNKEVKSSFDRAKSVMRKETCNFNKMIESKINYYSDI